MGMLAPASRAFRGHCDNRNITLDGPEWCSGLPSSVTAQFA